MKTKLLIPLILISLTTQLFAQDPNWTYIRRENTGIGGQAHYVVKGDAFDNIWTGGYTSSQNEGSLVRIKTNDTVYTNWGTYSENFLPNGIIYDIVFDNTGVIWVGTGQGIATSGDGLEWEHYETSNSPLLADQVEGMDIGPSNEVWVVTTDPNVSLGGVGKFNGATWEYYTFLNSGLPAGATFKDIAVDDSNNVWIASDYGLIKYDGTDWTQFTVANSDLSSDNIIEVLIDDQNRVWALVGNAVDIFDGTAWTQINETDWPISDFAGVSMDIRGDLVILTEGNGGRILMFDGTDWQTEDVNYTIYDCHIDGEGNYWVSGYGVVGKFDNTDWTRYTENNTGLPTNFNEDIFIDSQGRRWFANGNGGIQVFDCPNWEVYGPENEGLFPNPQTLYSTTIGTSITEDADGDIWFSYDGTSGYVIHIPGGNYHDYAAWTTFDNTNSTPSLQLIEELKATDDGKLFARNDGNVIMYDKVADTWTVWNNSNGLTSSPISLGSNGNVMYVGHYQGIDVFENGTWTNMDLTPQGIEHVLHIAFDVNENMWLGTTTGLWKFDGTDWTNWNETNSNIAANNVTAIDFDADNNVYISAHNTYTWPYYGGISYFDGTGTTFTTFLDGSSPLAHKQVEDIAVDSFGNVWALTQSEGFSIYNPNGIDGFECIDRSLERILSVEDFNDNGFLNAIAHPNPTTGITNIVFTSRNTGSATITVFDLLGRKVQAVVVKNVVTGKNSITIDLSQQGSGIYFCRIVSGEGSATVKVLKG